MTAAFWWGLATIPIFVGMCALAAACVIGLAWALARWGGEHWRVGGAYPAENIAAVMALSKSFHRVLYIPGFYFIRAKREGFRDREYQERALAYARAIRSVRAKFEE